MQGTADADIHAYVQVQAIQKQLLELLYNDHPEAMYPAAICALADLREVLCNCLL